jgi:uncharacterized Rossmann fold enzyme
VIADKFHAAELLFSGFYFGLATQRAGKKNDERYKKKLSPLQYKDPRCSTGSCDI